MYSKNVVEGKNIRLATGLPFTNTLTNLMSVINTEKTMQENNSQIIIYQTESGETKLEVAFNDETVWLTQMQLSELFGKSKKTISEHIRNIFKEEELDENSVVRNFRTTERIKTDTHQQTTKSSIYQSKKRLIKRSAFFL